MWIVTLKFGSNEWPCCIDADDRQEAIRKARGEFPEARVLAAVETDELDPGAYYRRFI